MVHRYHHERSRCAGRCEGRGSLIALLITGAAFIVGMAIVIPNIREMKTPLYDSCVWGPPVAWIAKPYQINTDDEKFVLLNNVSFTSNVSCNGAECYGAKLYEIIDILAFNGSRDCFLYEYPTHVRDIWSATEPQYYADSNLIALAVCLGIVAIGMWLVAGIYYCSDLELCECCDRYEYQNENRPDIRSPRIRARADGAVMV